MPQLKGQPGSSGMNPPGGVSTINLSNWSGSTPSSVSRRNIQANDDNSSQSGNENPGSRPSAGLSESNSSCGIGRMHQQAPGGNSTISFGAQSTAAESETLLKKRPGYDEKRKEMCGSGIFNETSGSCDGDAGYGGFADKAPAVGENQSPRGGSPRSYGGEDQSENTPASNFDGAKQRELCNSNENLNDLTGRLSFSNAKARELAGDNIFGPSPQDAPIMAAHNREPAGKRSQLMLNNLHDENPDSYGPKRHEMKSAKLSGNNVLHGGPNAAGDETPHYHQRSEAKVKEMSGSDIFSDHQPKARNTIGGIRKPPGGGSTIMLA